VVSPPKPRQPRQPVNRPPSPLPAAVCGPDKENTMTPEQEELGKRILGSYQTAADPDFHLSEKTRLAVGLAAPVVGLIRSAFQGVFLWQDAPTPEARTILGQFDTLVEAAITLWNMLPHEMRETVLKVPPPEHLRVPHKAELPDAVPADVPDSAIMDAEVFRLTLIEATHRRLEFLALERRLSAEGKALLTLVEEARKLHATSFPGVPLLLAAVSNCAMLGEDRLAGPGTAPAGASGGPEGKA
jgi:hypothetical protein